MGILTPPLKWAGGKQWLVPTLQKHYNPKDRLIDLFAGGLSVSLGLNPKHAIANDLNEHTINFYQQLQLGLVVDLKLENTSEYFYFARGIFNILIKEDQQLSKEAAILFYYLNRSCFNGLCRFNKKGFFNVPYGKYKNLVYQTDFLAYKDVLSQWTITNVDFEDAPILPGDFVYADPPYDVEFKSYSKQGFNWDDQVRLANHLSKLDAKVIASNQATPRILDLYRGLGFQIETVLAPRRISCKGDRTPAKEMLAYRNFDHDPP